MVFPSVIVGAKMRRFLTNWPKALYTRLKDESQNPFCSQPDRLFACRRCPYRTLYSWLFAKNQGGEFVLRIEDTDLERSTQEAIDAIIEGMEWLELNWDEGPYYQTKRFDRYNGLIDEMLADGRAWQVLLLQRAAGSAA